MPATLTTVASILKEIYEPPIREQLQNKVVALRRIERSSDGIESNVGGKYVTFPLHTRRNAGLGARNENEQLPTAGQQGYAAARVPLKYLYGLVRMTGQTYELANTNPQAFASALDGEINGLKKDLAKDSNRQVYGDASGAIGTAGAATVTTNTFLPVTAMYFQEGMQIDIIDGTTLGNPTPTVIASNRQVTDIDLATNTVTFDGATASTSIGDIAVRTGSVNREWSGLETIVQASGTFENVDPTVEKTWTANVDDNGGTLRPLSEGLMTLMADTIRTRGGDTTVILQSLGVRRAYANLLTQQRRYVNTQKFTGGFSGLAFTTDEGDIPVVADTDAPPNTQWYLNEKEITYYREGDWSWMNRDGSMWSRVQGFDAYEGIMYQYSELGTHQRNSQGRINDITEA